MSDQNTFVTRSNVPDAYITHLFGAYTVLPHIVNRSAAWWKLSEWPAKKSLKSNFLDNKKNENGKDRFFLLSQFSSLFLNDS